MTLLLCILGALAGIVSGLFGIGGAVLVVPALVYFFKYPQHMAQGTSLAMLLPPFGLLAVMKYWQAGQVQVKPALILAATFMLGTYLGAAFAVNVPELLMKRLFGGFLILIGVLMLSGR